MDSPRLPHDVNTDKPTPEEAEDPKSSASSEAGRRFDVLCILTKSNAKAILSPEFQAHIKALNLDMKDLKFVHFSQIYELNAMSEFGPQGYEIYEYNPDSCLDKQHRATKEEGEHLSEQLRDQEAPGTEDKYDSDKRIVSGEGGIELWPRKQPKGKTTKALEKREAIEAETRNIVESHEGKLQDDQTIESLSAHLVATLLLYGDNIEYLDLEVDKSVLELANAIIALNKGEGETTQTERLNSASAPGDKDVEDKKTIDKLKDQILQTFNNYNRKRLETGSDVDGDKVGRAERVLKLSTKTMEEAREDAKIQKDIQICPCKTTEEGSKETTEAG